MKNNTLNEYGQNGVDAKEKGKHILVGVSCSRALSW